MFYLNPHTLMKIKCLDDMKAAVNGANEINHFVFYVSGFEGAQTFALNRTLGVGFGVKTSTHKSAAVDHNKTAYDTKSGVTFCVS